MKAPHRVAERAELSNAQETLPSCLLLSPPTSLHHLRCHGSPGWQPRVGLIHVNAPLWAAANHTSPTQ